MACAGPTNMPCARNSLIVAIECLLQKRDAGMYARYGYYLRIVNCEDTGYEGDHWILCLIKTDLSVIWLFDPLRGSAVSRGVFQKVAKIYPVDSLEYHCLGYQADGWRCGYWTLY